MSQHFGIATSQSVVISIAKSQIIAILIATFSSITKSIAKCLSIVKSNTKIWNYCKSVLFFTECWLVIIILDYISKFNISSFFIDNLWWIRLFPYVICWIQMLYLLYNFFDGYNYKKYWNFIKIFRLINVSYGVFL